MKRTKSYFAFCALALAALLAFTGCKNEPDTPPVVRVTGVTLNQPTATLDVGGTVTLTATVAPSNAANKNVTWSSNPASVATVSGGVVTGVAPGPATITVTTQDGSFTATCTVTVNEVVVPPAVTITPAEGISTSGVNEIKYSEAIDAEGNPAEDLSVEVSSPSIGAITLKLTTDNEAITAAFTAMGLAEGFELGTLSDELATTLAGFFGEGLPTGDAVVGQTKVKIDFSAILPLITGIPGGVEQFDIEIAAEDEDSEVASATQTLKFKFTDDNEYVTIAGADFDIDEDQEILASTQDEAAVVVDVAAAREIENFFVEITSTSELFSGALTTFGLANEFDIANPGPLASVLSGISLANGDAVKGKTELEFDISGFIPMLFGFIAGGDFEASFKIRVVDALGYEAEKTLTLNLVNDMYVAITGDGLGENPLEIKYSETFPEPTIPVAVNIEAPQGIENFKVLISSDSPVFTGALAGLGLDAEFDLANPDEALTATLGILAAQQIVLPAGDDVKGETELAFDITGFVPMIFATTGEAGGGDLTASFKLTVTDTKGNTETATIKLSLIDDSAAEGGDEGEGE